MAFSKSSMLHLLVVSMFLASLSLTEAQSPLMPKQFCANTTTFAPNSTYHTNRDRLLSSLTSNATIPTTGFLNTTVGRSPDVVYGLFQCRGDVSADACKDCVQEASKQLKQLCPVQKVSIIYFDECLLRYSDENFFSVVTKMPDYQLRNTQTVSDPVRFIDLMTKTMRETASEAANSTQNGKKFGTEKVNYTSFQNLYTLAQCTADLSVRDCNSCLDDAVSKLPSCCNGKEGGRVLMPSCNVRYELYSFYNEDNVPADPPENEPLGPGSTGGKSGISSGTIIAIVVPIGVVLMLVFMMFCFIRSRAKTRYENIHGNNVSTDITTVDSLQFDLAIIENATDKFSDANKLGEGGFGEVFKGTLSNGDQIAVKRLSKSSGQGAHEFKNEVVLVAKLQHKNLVRLLGFCCQGEEKILVYEYVPNKSLDYMLFDSENNGRLDWARRYKIIAGIAKGILYLHEDSRLRIIHRDLKASNILLDSNLNPKISDFGMAKIFGVDQTQGNTSRIVGTYGYMSPEYVMQGHFSVKSDVYSFGVLVLEIICGKKSNGFYQSGEAQGLLSYAAGFFAYPPKPLSTYQQEPPNEETPETDNLRITFRFYDRVNNTIGSRILNDDSDMSNKASVESMNVVERRIAFPPPPLAYFLGYTLPPGHPYNSFNLPPPRAACPVCCLPVEEAIALMPKVPTYTPVLRNLTYVHEENLTEDEDSFGGSDFGG